jgi:hypothetical protein
MAAGGLKTTNWNTKAKEGSPGSNGASTPRPRIDQQRKATNQYPSTPLPQYASTPVRQYPMCIWPANAVTPNPSLEPTRYGMRCMPASGPVGSFPSAGKQPMPAPSAQLER